MENVKLRVGEKQSMSIIEAMLLQRVLPLDFEKETNDRHDYIDIVRQDKFSLTPKPNLKCKIAVL